MLQLDRIGCLERFFKLLDWKTFKIFLAILIISKRKLKGNKSSLIIKKTILKNFRHNGNFRKEVMQKEKIQRNCINYARIFALYSHEILFIMQKLEMENYLYLLFIFIYFSHFNLYYTPLLTTDKSNQKTHITPFTG